MSFVGFSPSEISDFALNTDTRAAQREDYDNMIKAKEAEILGMKREREERRAVNLLGNKTVLLCNNLTL